MWLLYIVSIWNLCKLLYLSYVDAETNLLFSLNVHWAFELETLLLFDLYNSPSQTCPPILLKSHHVNACNVCFFQQQGTLLLEGMWFKIVKECYSTLWCILQWNTTRTVKITCNENHFNKNRVIRTATKRTETSECPPCNALTSLVHFAVQLHTVD